MAQHLSREQMTRYRDRQLPPSELIDADLHLGSCAECRAALGVVDSAAGLIAALAAARGEHLSYEQMDAWVEDQLDSGGRELVMAHIALCDPCERQLRAYESYAPVMGAPIPPAARETTTWGDRVRAFFRTPRFALIASAALALVVLSPLVIWQTRHTGLLESLYGPSRPEALNDLPANRDSTLTYPVSEAIEEQQPIFEWRPSGSEPVEVVLYDAAHNEVAQSGPLSGTEWLDPVPLNRGAVYEWEVRTTVPGGGTRQASFRVLSEADHEKLAAARASRQSALTLGEMAREMGALTEAYRDFDAAVAADPNDGKARRLLEEIRQLQGNRPR